MICEFDLRKIKMRIKKMNEILEDFKLAKKVMENAYSPYSNYKVSAVLTAKNGKKYTGCNIENHGIQSICAERVAFAKAISEGERDFKNIVIIGGKSKEDLEECLPCGYCRQFISEFVDQNFKIYTWYKDKIKEYTITELLPFGFKL